MWALDGSVMNNFTFRELTRFEDSVVAYEGFVQQLGDGYAMCIYEYTNDLSCRQQLEDARLEAAVQELWSRVEAADSRLRQILRPTKRCIHGSHPQECFWYWGYPPDSPELETDLRAIDAL